MSHANYFADLWHARRHTARKPHHCSACSETICAGTAYRRIAVGGEGTVDTIRQCGRCAQIFDALCSAQPQEPILPTLDCGETWTDVFGEPEPGDIAALAFALPGEWCPGEECEEGDR